MCIRDSYRKARQAFLVGYDRSVPRLRQANHCIGCDQCSPHCPQSINKMCIRDRISAVFIIYPNIACLPWDIKFLEGVSCTGFYWYFVYRFFFFWGLICLLLRYNLRQLSTAQFKERFGRNFLYSLAAYAGFASISYWIHSYGIRTDFLGSTLISQFLSLIHI